MGSLGHWSTRNEEWYTDRQRALELCYLGEKPATNPVPPKSARQWRSTTRFGGFSKHFLMGTEERAGSMIRSHGTFLGNSSLSYTS